MADSGTWNFGAIFISKRALNDVEDAVESIN